MVSFQQAPTPPEPDPGPLLDEQGWWWPLLDDHAVPTLGAAMPQPEDALPGRLRFSRGGGARLEVFGAPAEWRERRPPVVRAIVGATISGRIVSLLDPWRLARRGTLQAGEEAVWIADLAVVGVHIGEEADLLGQWASFEMHGLREWLSDFWSGPEAWPIGPRESASMPATYRRRLQLRGRSWRGAAAWRHKRFRARAVQRSRELRRRRNWELDARRSVSATLDGGAVTLEMLERRHHGRWVDEIVRYASGFVSLDQPTDLATLERDWLEPLTDMLAFMTGRTSVVTRLAVGIMPPDAPSLDTMRGGLRPPTREIGVLRRRREPGPAPDLDGTLPLPAAAASSQRHELLPRWFAEHREIGRVGKLLFGTLQTRDQWPENELLNLVSFAEAYHERFYDYPVFDQELNRQLMNTALERVPEDIRQAWRDKLTWATRLTQRARLEELVNIAVSTVPQLAPYEDELVSQLTQTRNFLTHWGRRRAHVVDGRDLVLAIERLLIVLRSNVLWHMGVDDLCIQLAALRGDYRVGALGVPDEPA